VVTCPRELGRVREFAYNVPDLRQRSAPCNRVKPAVTLKMEELLWNAYWKASRKSGPF